MRRIFFLLLAGSCLAACAGNPPAWWNPGNRYGQTEQPASAAAVPAQPPARPAEPVVKEVNLDPLPDNSYEEEAISPLPEEEDTPTDAPVTEPALDDSLPAPSILE